MASSESRNQPQSNLHQQDLTKLDITKLTPLSPEVISRQATINIGTIGHVAHGKSTVVKAISGVQTVRFKNELERNITIKLERLSDTILKLYKERTCERIEHNFFEKAIRPKKRVYELDPDDSDCNNKKQKNGKKEKDEYIIESIKRFKIVDGVPMFYVKWKGYSNQDNTWEPQEHLDNCPLILSSYVSDLEVKYCEQIEKIQDEISFHNLLSQENLIKRLQEVEHTDISDLKINLVLKLVGMIKLSDSEECHASALVESSRNMLQLYKAARIRCNQLMLLKTWEEHLNQVDQSKKLVVENNVDFAGPPENFTYINQSIPGSGVVIPDDPPIGCDCTACNCRSKTCCGTQGGFFAYTAKKRLRVAPGTPIYECNKACKCSQDCNNRVVQCGRNVKLCIFRTSNGCGWGVRTEQIIRDGQFICQYVGEVITFEEAEKRGREYDANGLTYLFDLDFNSVENPYTVDAANMGNVSHFINHSCDPNLGVWAVWADCLDPNLPMITLFATRDIQAGEEINFDYLQNSLQAEEKPSNSTPDVENDFSASVPETQEPPIEYASTKPRFEIKQVTKSHRNLTECKCGAASCRKYLF